MYQNGSTLFAGVVSSDQEARSFPSHLASYPYEQNTFRARLSVYLRIRSLADGASASLNQVLNVLMCIIHGEIALDQELSSREVECVRDSAEIMNLGSLAPVFEAPGACQARNVFPQYFATMPHQEALL